MLCSSRDIWIYCAWAYLPELFTAPPCYDALVLCHVARSGLQPHPLRFCAYLQVEGTADEVEQEITIPPPTHACWHTCSSDGGLLTSTSPAHGADVGGLNVQNGNNFNHSKTNVLLWWLTRAQCLTVRCVIGGGEHVYTPESWLYWRRKVVLLFSSLLHNKSVPFPFIFAAVLLFILCSSWLGKLCREIVLKGRGRWDIKKGVATGSKRSGEWRGGGDRDRDGEKGGRCQREVDLPWGSGFSSGGSVRSMW